MRQKAPIPKSRTKIGVFLVALTIVTVLSSSSVIGLQFSANVIGEDNEPPLVTDPTAIPASIAANGVQEAQLSVNVTDRSGIYSVTVDLTPIGGPQAKELEYVFSSNSNYLILPTIIPLQKSVFSENFYIMTAIPYQAANGQRRDHQATANGDCST